MKNMRFALLMLFVVSVVAQARVGSWMKQLSGVGRSGSPQMAEKAANNNLDSEIDAHEDLCRSHNGKSDVKRMWRAACQQYPFNWQCTAVATFTCRFP